MDFHSMKRKQLQALCRKHKIPANLSNKEMANKLTEFLKEKENPLIQQSAEGHDENVVESEFDDANVKRKVNKKVRFSPVDELFEFTRSPLTRKRSSGNSVDNSEMKKEILGGLGRCRGLKPIEDQVNVKKRGRKAVKSEKNSAIGILDDGKLKEGRVDNSAGVVMLSGRIEVSVEAANKVEMKRGKDSVKTDAKATDHDAVDKTRQDIVDIPGRVTRSRVQKLTEVHGKVQKGGRKVAARVANAVLHETEENRVDSGEGEHNGKGEVLEKKNNAEECRVTGLRISTRRSKRNANIVSDSKILNADSKKHENGDLGSKKTAKLALDGSGGSGETGNHVRMEPKRRNRRKNVIDDLVAETESHN